MSKKEFLDGLCEQLAGQMSGEKIQNHVRYYQEYIETQMKNGVSESDVIERLGTPQLIAKTLLDADAANAENDNYYSEDAYSRYERNEYDVTYGDDFSSTHRQESDSYNTNGYMKNHMWHIDLNTWYGKLLVIAFAVLVIALLIFVIGTIVPILIVVFLVLSVISYIKRKSGR